MTVLSTREATAAERAIVLTRAVRDADPARVHALLAEYAAVLPDVAVVLASRVATLEALGRVVMPRPAVRQPQPAPQPSGKHLRAAHAAYEAARIDGRLTPALRAGDRDYGREAKRASNARGAQRRRGGETGPCPVCGRVFRLRVNGQPYQHKRGAEFCPGAPTWTPEG